MNARLYVKEDCGLCDEAAAVLRRLRREIGFGLEFVYIEADPQLFEQYSERIPVLEVDGEEAAWAPLDETAIRRALKV